MARRRVNRFVTALLLAALLSCGAASAQTLYKYRGENGEWLFSDRPPADGQQAETRSIATRVERGGLTVASAFNGTSVRLTANNRFFAPMEVVIEFQTITGAAYPPSGQELSWLVPERSALVLLELATLDAPIAPTVRYRFAYLPGDPNARPASGVTYRAPFAAGASYPITQTYPDSLTHRTRDSMYAVDIAMPVGTDIMAARDGVVFEVASKNFKGGPDADEYADLANLVRILHDDGTYAVYAHLNWNTIRVRPGERVRAGQYIADSGNTGFSTGPHLHFAVQRNMGQRVDSLPFAFRGANAERVVPVTGQSLAAYP
ncbi:MAG: M23 family metallopeptidase [Gammaproteobacteria bacterium]|nr:M23 family metallopeptidase [Gammaproteobacteria bacterium]